MNNLLRLVVLVFVFGAHQPALATPGTDNSRAQVQEVMHLSGLARALDQIPASLDVQLAQQKELGAQGEEFDTFSKIIKEAYDPAVLYEAVTRELESRYDATRFPQLIRQLRKPLVRTMTQLEVDAASPDAQQRMMEFAKSLQHAPLPDTRLRRIKQLMAVTGSVEGVVDIQLATIQAIMKGMNPLMPANQRVTPELMNQRLSEIRFHMEPQVRQWVGLTMSYTYRNVSDQELDDYISLYETEVGAWSTELFTQVLQTIMGDIAKEVGERAAKEAIREQAPDSTT